MAIDCNLRALINASKCFLEPCMSEWDRESILIFARVKNLAASGGTNYLNNLNGLLQASKEWQVLSGTQRSAIDLYIDLTNAVNNGATINTARDELMVAARCYRCLGHELRKQILGFLKCAINNLAKPD